METVARTCPVCSTEYQASVGRLKFNRHTTCSKECSYKFRAAHLSKIKTGKPSPLKGVPSGKPAWNKTEGVHINCGHCGVPMRIEPNQAGRKKFCSKDCFFEGRELKNTFKKGSEHPAWVNGLSLNEYPAAFNKRLKFKIRQRDEFKCQLCGITEEKHLERFKRVLTVNHIDFDKNNCDESNLNTLCTSCNTKINWDRQKWTSHFMEQMKHA
jgi:hypothetical protein